MLVNNSYRIISELLEMRLYFSVTQPLSAVPGIGFNARIRVVKKHGVLERPWIESLPIIRPAFSRTEKATCPNHCNSETIPVFGSANFGDLVESPGLLT